jgi:hypothetical protein
LAEHVDIVDAERHELKGASTAVTGEVPKSNGDGTTTFGNVDYPEITNTPQGTAVADVDPGATTTAIANKVNELLASLRAAGLLGV